MTKKALIDICKEHELYRTAELNDKIYCNFKGFVAITPALGAYCNLKALFLEGNALTSLQGMPSLVHLRCLFVQQNLLTDLSGLESLPFLDTLNISNNRIEKLTHLDGVPQLSTLIAAGNLFKSKEDIEQLRQCPSLQTLDLQSNKLEDVEILEVLKEMSELRCLYLKGNDVVPKIRNYRKTVVSRLKSSTYLDDRPVFETERRITDAWARGGLEAERMEREAIKEEKRERDRKNFEYLQQIRREGWRKRREALGLPPGDTDPYFDGLSSDASESDTEPAELTQARDQLNDEWRTLSGQDDGIIYLDAVKENEKALIASRQPSEAEETEQGVQEQVPSSQPGHQISVIRRDIDALNF